MQHHHVPIPVQQRPLLLIMEIQPLAAHRLQADIVIQPGLLGEFLEDGGHPADGLAVCVGRIEVMHFAGAVMLGGGMFAEGEAVAYEQDGFGMAGAGTDGQGDQGAEQMSHDPPLFRRL